VVVVMVVVVVVVMVVVGDGDGGDDSRDVFRFVLGWREMPWTRTWREIVGTFDRQRHSQGTAQACHRDPPMAQRGKSVQLHATIDAISED
jgi:hypothetical protein